MPKVTKSQKKENTLDNEMKTGIKKSNSHTQKDTHLPDFSA